MNQTATSTAPEKKQPSKLFVKKNAIFLKLLGYRFTLFMILGLVAINIFFSAQLWIIKRTRPEPDYYIVDIKDEARRIKPLTRPNLSLSQLLIWVMQASTAAYTFDFLNVENQLADVKTFFTNSGYDSFINSLQRDGLLSQVRQGKLIVSSVPTGMPVVAAEYNHPNGSYTWEIQMPLRISFQSANETRSVDSIQTVTVERIATTDSPRGVGISQIQMRKTNVSR